MNRITPLQWEAQFGPVERQLEGSGMDRMKAFLMDTRYIWSKVPSYLAIPEPLDGFMIVPGFKRTAEAYYLTQKPHHNDLIQVWDEDTLDYLLTNDTKTD